MKIKVIYRRNLKMSEGKLAAQVAHAVLGLKLSWPDVDWDGRIIVLKVSDKKFMEFYENDRNHTFGYFQTDWGLSELEKDTVTTFAYYEE